MTSPASDLLSSLTQNNDDTDMMANDPLSPTDEEIVVIEEEAPRSNNNIIDNVDDDFNDPNNSSNFLQRRCARYLYAVSRLLVKDVFLETTSADNPSLVSKLLRLGMTTTSYSLLYTTLCGHLLWGIAYLMDHTYWMLAASGCVTLLCLSVLLLTSYEWMWRWQERVFDPIVLGRCCCSGNASADYEALGTTQQQPQRRRRRQVVIHDEDEMEDDLSIRGWAKRFGKIFGFCLVWIFYCLVNVRVDFFITDLYLMARPEHYRFELLLVNCIEAAPILMGAAVFMHFAYPPFFTWHAPAPINGVIATAHVDLEPARESESGNQDGLQALL